MMRSHLSNMVRGVFLCSILFYSSLLAQNNIRPQASKTALRSCFAESNLPWSDDEFFKTQALNHPVSLVIFRAIEPTNRQELLFEIDQKIYRTHRLVGQSWNKPVAVDPSIARFMRQNWSALRDDLVKPFRAKLVQRIDDQSVRASDETELAQIGLSAQDRSYDYVLFYRDFCVTRQFRQKDLGLEWADYNQTFTFNQTLKLTKLHRMVDDVFLYR